MDVMYLQIRMVNPLEKNMKENLTAHVTFSIQLSTKSQLNLHPPVYLRQRRQSSLLIGKKR